MKNYIYLLRILWPDENGAVATEYAILISCIAAAIAAGVTLFGAVVQNLYQKALDSFPS
jgi:Flp pilus assembly pilin Flp